MPDFANLKRALLSQGEPARVPLFEGSIHEDVKTRFLNRPAKDLAGEVEFHMRAGYDYVPLTIGLRQMIRGETSGVMGAKNVETSILKEASGRYNPFQNQLTKRMWAEEGAGLIRDHAAFDNYPWPEADSFNYSAVKEIGQLLPGDAKAIINVGYVFTAAWMLMGLERFCFSLAEDDGLAAKVIDRVGRIQQQVVEILVQHEAVGAIRMPDDLGYTTGLMVSPRVFREHVFPWNKKIGEVVRSKGLPYLYHSDGRLYDVIEDLLECGFCALHPCEPASMDISLLKRKYAGRLSLSGNIDLDSTLTMGTPEEVEEEVKTRIREIAPGGGYCCGASNSVPEYVPYENYIAMIEAVKKYGEYPIRV